MIKQPENPEDRPYIAPPHITMSEIDLDRLEDIEDNPEAVSFRILLSERPSDAWKTEFDVIYQRTPYALKPPVVVERDALQIVYLPRYAPELQGFLQFLAFIVKRANEELLVTEELHVSTVHENSKVDFLEALRHTKIPFRR